MIPQYKSPESYSQQKRSEKKTFEKQMITERKNIYSCYLRICCLAPAVKYYLVKIYKVMKTQIKKKMTLILALRSIEKEKVNQSLIGKDVSPLSSSHYKKCLYKKKAKAD